MKNYKFGFEWQALVLFALIMLPNIIWFCLPAPNDILREPSQTAALEITASVFQIITVAALCAVVNTTAEKLKYSSLRIIAALVLVACYYALWIAYYCGIYWGLLLIFMCIFPCVALILYAAERKNYPALIPATVFAILHIIFGFINFI